MAKEAAGVVQQLSTENVNVAMMIAAHNAAVAIIESYSGADDPEAQADRYVVLYKKIITAIA